MVVAIDPTAEHKSHYSKELCIHKGILSSSQGPFHFPITLDMDKFLFNWRHSALGFLGRGVEGNLAMKGGPFFCQDILNKRLQDQAELLADGELESACLASSQESSCPGQSPRGPYCWTCPDGLLSSEAPVLERQGQAVFHCCLGDSGLEK